MKRTLNVDEINNVYRLTLCWSKLKLIRFKSFFILFYKWFKSFQQCPNIKNSVKYVFSPSKYIIFYF
jgi:hypothetical protein